MKSESGTGTGTGTPVSMGNAFAYFDFYNAFQANADSFTLYGTLLSNGLT
jgi:hypothetical protein